jgi:hypothetical protein
MRFPDQPIVPGRVLNNGMALPLADAPGSVTLRHQRHEAFSASCPVRLPGREEQGRDTHRTRATRVCVFPAGRHSVPAMSPAHQPR